MWSAFEQLAARTRGRSALESGNGASHGRRCLCWIDECGCFAWASRTALLCFALLCFALLCVALRQHRLGHAAAVGEKTVRVDQA